VRLMGWSAHGDICGGFPPGTSNEEIKTALLRAVEIQVKRYKEATHFVYFATLKKEGDTEETVVYSMICGKGAKSYAQAG